MKSELILITRHYHEDELRCWLNWHLNIIHIDKILVLDNESHIDVKTICDSFPNDRVKYCFIKGDGVDQYEVYNSYLSELDTDSNWVMALDDDEFLYIGEKYHHNVNEMLKDFYEKYHCNKCYAQWINLYSKHKMEEKTDLYINTHTYYSFEAAQKLIATFKNGCNRYGKCFFRNEDGLKYIYRRCTGRWVGHSPKCLNGDDTLRLVSGEILESDWVNFNNEINTNCFIAHYQFKNKRDWRIKCLRPLIANPRVATNKENMQFVYDYLYKFSYMFKSCALLKDLYNSYQFSVT